MPFPFLRFLAARFAFVSMAFAASFAALSAQPLLPGSSLSPHPGLSVSPVPAWVAGPLDPFREVSLVEEQTADLDYLVSERQILVRERAAFVHFAYRVAAPGGLSDAAEFSLTFDPAYERVALHHLRLVRDGRVEERLALGDFEVIRQERDRDRALYDGRLTAIHQLRDVRVGDVIDYAYTITGANPVFGPHYVDGLSLGWNKPVRQFRYRILHPGNESGGRFFQLLGDGAWGPATHTHADGRRELIWEKSPLAGRVPDSGHPSWHLAYPFVQLGDFTGWADVVDWALPLYAADTEAPALRAKIAELRAAAPDDLGRIAAALAFVQEEIRYLGIELGANSHRPTPPAETLARRFGDCKDKTLLLCALLRGLEIEADPAFVNSWMGRPVSTPLGRAAAAPGLHASLPTPLAFDHVIARVRAAGGDTLWLDATRRHQTGPLAERGADDFGQALIIRKGETRLVDMARSAAAPGRLHEEITFTSHAFDKPADVEIRSTFDGERATSMRSYLAGITVAQITRDYLNFYLQKYPGLTSGGPVTWTDDTARNRIQLLEKYSLPDFWSQAEKAGVWKCELYPYAISELVRAPGTQTRRAPLALGYPSETRAEIRVRLHEDWDVEPMDVTVENSFLRYVSSARKTGREILLRYDYLAKEDHVPAAEVPAYAASLVKIRADLGLFLTKDTNGAAETPAGFRLNPWSVLVTLLTCAAGFWFAWRVLRRRRRRRRDPNAPPALPGAASPGIGGWLLLFGLGVVVRCITAFTSSAGQVSTYFDLTIWENLTSATSSARNLPLAALILAELAGNLFFIFLVWVAAILFFQRRRTAPRWNIVVLLYLFGFSALDMAVSGLIANTPAEASDWKNLFRTLMGALIWVPYLSVSERVKETFVR